MEKFSEFITEAKEESYKLVVLSHDDPLDPNETGPLIRKKAQELGLEVFLGEFQGSYTHVKNGKRYLVDIGTEKKNYGA